MNGRHYRAAGFNADVEEYLAAGLLSWRVFRLGSEQIRLEVEDRLVAIMPTSQESNS